MRGEVAEKPQAGILIKKEKPWLCAKALFWRRHPDLNRGMRVLQTLALPLGYSAVPRRGDKKTVRQNFVERETRFEPATFTLAR